MTRSRWWLALPALLIATSGPASAFDIRDKAGMFSAEAARKADAELDRIAREYQVPVTVETIDSLNGGPINEVLAQEARKIDARGLFVLIAKKDHKIQVESYKTYAKYLTRPRDIAIREAFEKDFAHGDFDAGLVKGIEKIDTTFSEARAEAGGSLRPTTPAATRPGARPAPGGGAAVPQKPSMGAGSLITIVLGILGVLLVIRILGALFSAGRRGYGNQGQMMGRGPGYGGYGGGGGYGGAPGGGGFMSSMFGGIGGAMAGNWLYDQFSGGRHHGGTADMGNTIDPGVTGTPAETGGADWVGPNDGGGDWGGGGADAGGGWGGEAGGGGGGGDWGGGGGGGDWGGGGGGGDTGGSW